MCLSDISVKIFRSNNLYLVYFKILTSVHPFTPLYMMYCKVMAEPLFLTFPIFCMIYEQIHTIFLLVNIFILWKGESLGWTESCSENHSIFEIV